MAHSVGLDFYGILSGEYWLTVVKEPFYLFPYPGMLAARSSDRTSSFS